MAIDNQPREIQAETFTTSQLIKYGFKVTKPSFDKIGADLLIIESIRKKFTKFLIVQCKGRTMSTSATSVVIRADYVKDNFVLFVHLIDYEKKEVLLLFFPEEIKMWKLVNQKYSMSFSPSKLAKGVYSEYCFENHRADKLLSLLNKAEIKKYTSIIIDGIFLEKALQKAIHAYSQIYPDKNFERPYLDAIVKNILEAYDKFETEKKIVNCYVILSADFHLENHVEIKHSKNSFLTRSQNQVTIFTTNTKELVGFEVLDQLERLVNNENIILVADDILYESKLQKLKDDGVDIILVKLHEDDGGKLFVHFRWGDITYPLGLAIGLDVTEL